MFSKLAQKYRVPNPLDDAALPNMRETSSPGQTTAAGFGISGTSGASPFATSAPGTNHNTSSPFMNKEAPLGSSLFTPSSGHASAQSPFGIASSTISLAPAFGNSAGPMSSPFAQALAPFPSFGQTPSAVRSPSPFAAGASSQLGQSQGVPMASFGGKSPRDLLTAFYQEKNPTKIAEVDKLLTKYQVRLDRRAHIVLLCGQSHLKNSCCLSQTYQGQEEQLFRNLAKKYNLDPSVFGLSASQAENGTGAQPPGIAGSPLAFGQPTPFGGGPTFGMSSPAPSFGGAALSGGFAGSSSSSAGGFGAGFGAAAGAIPFGSASFGALAQAPAQSGFGALAQAPAQSSFGGFGSPPTASATPFGSPFGAPRR